MGGTTLYTILTRGVLSHYFDLVQFSLQEMLTRFFMGAPSVHAMAAQANVNDYRRSESSQLLMHWDDRGLYEDHGMTVKCLVQ